MADERKPALLIGDGDRERGIESFRDAVLEGRLTLEEFSERVGNVQLARTEPDLAAQLADLPAQPKSVALSTPAVKYRAVCSKLVRSGPWELSEQAVSFSCIFGTIQLDLRQATLHDRVVDLHLFNLFGTVTLIVPEGIAVSVDGSAPFASQVITAPSAPPVPGSPQLRIHSSGPGGTLYVTSRGDPGD